MLYLRTGTGYFGEIPGSDAGVVALEVCHVTDIRLGANFETETTPGINRLPVFSGAEIRLEPERGMMRISEPEHQLRSNPADLQQGP
jgi:hypothetical protein